MQSAALVMRLSALLAAGFSAAAAADYYGGAHTFCAEGSGCDAVRHSTWGQSLGQVLPALGMCAFALIVLLSLSRRARLRMLSQVAALTGAIAGALLLALQAFGVGAFCSLCVGADLAAIMAGAAALVWLRAPDQPIDADVGSPLARAIFRGALALALCGPIAWSLSIPVHVPPYVSSLGQSGKINVVEFSDFECPYCRGLHPHLLAAMAPYGERVHFVRKSFPLPGHRNARHAARAYLCAIEQGRGDEMAHAIFGSGNPDVTTCERIARELGLELSKFQACVASEGTDRRIDEDMEAIRGADFHGLPTVWIGDQKLEGFDRDAGAAPYEAALARAASGSQAGVVWRPWTATVALALLLAGGGLFGRRKAHGETNGSAGDPAS